VRQVRYGVGMSLDGFNRRWPRWNLVDDRGPDLRLQGFLRVHRYRSRRASLLRSADYSCFTMTWRRAPWSVRDE